jgi:hypothetical protein
MKVGPRLDKSDIPCAELVASMPQPGTRQFWPSIPDEVVGSERAMS